MSEKRSPWEKWKVAAAVIGFIFLAVGSIVFGVKRGWLSSPPNTTDKLPDTQRTLENSAVDKDEGAAGEAGRLLSPDHAIIQNKEGERNVGNGVTNHEEIEKNANVSQKSELTTSKTNAPLPLDSKITIACGDVPDPFGPKAIAKTSADDIFELQKFFLESKDPFSLAHNAFLIHLKTVIESETYEKAIESKYIAVKTLYDRSKFPNLSPVYDKGNAKEAALEILSTKALLDGISSKCRECAKLEDMTEMASLYKLLKDRRIFSENVDPWASAFSLSDYVVESTEFIKAFAAAHKHILLQAFFDTVADSIIDVNRDEKIVRIVEWIHLYVPVSPAVDRLPFVRIGAESVTTAFEARLFLIQNLLSSAFGKFIIFHEDYEKLTAALGPILGTFNRLHAHPQHCPVFGQSDTLIKFMEEHFKPKFFPPKRAVLSGKPRKLNNSLVCYANCLLQALANFLPLLETASVWNSTFCEGRAESYKNAIRQVAKETDEPLELKSILDLSRFSESKQYNPIPVLYDFCKSFSGDMYGFTKVCGFLILCENKIVDLPWLSAIVFPGFAPPLPYMHAMLGPLFIAEFREPIHPMNVSLHLDMNVQFESRKKRYELYSIIFGIKSKVHAVAYVRRTNDKWYCTDSLNPVEEVNVEDIPLQAAQQKTEYKVLMVFYLRIEE